MPQISSDTKRKLFFMNYREILEYLHLKGIKNNYGNEITMNQLKVAVFRMEQRHKECEWRSELARKQYHYVISEGVMWLEQVYFRQNKKSAINAEIEFFLNRVLWYEQFCRTNNIFYPDFHYKDFNRMNFREKKEYLKVLEARKMELTRICMKAGLPYNDFKLMN